MNKIYTKETLRHPKQFEFSTYEKYANCCFTNQCNRYLFLRWQMTLRENFDKELVRFCLNWDEPECFENIIPSQEFLDTFGS